MKKLLAFCLALTSVALPIVHAATAVARVTLIAPTAYTNGTPIPAGAITSYEVECDFIATGTTTKTNCDFTPTTLTPAQLTRDLTVTYPGVGGTACFYSRARTATQVSARSPDGPQNCKPLPADPLIPNAPGAVVVVVTVSISP